MGILDRLNDAKKAVEKIGRNLQSQETDSYAGQTEGKKASLKQCRKGLDRLQKEMDLFLALQGDAALPDNMKKLSRPLRDCFEAWQPLPTLQADRVRAEIVLSAYYRKEKIQDLLKQLRDYADQMDTEESDEIARSMAYNNYIFFIDLCMREMKDQYAAQIQSPLEKPALTPDNVAWFINAQCGHIVALRDLPKARVLAKQVLDDEDTDQLNRAYKEVNLALELLMMMPENTIQQLQAQTAVFIEREKSIREKIDRGTKLFHDLTNAMPEEWFLPFDPKAVDSPVLQMSRSELKAFYQERLGQLGLPEEPFSVE